jgi:hypothetical protein
MVVDIVADDSSRVWSRAPPLAMMSDMELILIMKVLLSSKGVPKMLAT